MGGGGGVAAFASEGRTCAEATPALPTLLPCSRASMNDMFATGVPTRGKASANRCDDEATIEGAREIPRFNLDCDPYFDQPIRPSESSIAILGWVRSGRLREISLPSQRERDESGTNEPSIQESRDARAADGSSSTQQQTLRAALEGG